MEQRSARTSDESMVNPYASQSIAGSSSKSKYRVWTMIGVAFLFSLSFLASTVAADSLPDKTNHSFWFPLSVYSLPFTVPGMLLVHMGYSDIPVYFGSFFVSFMLSLGTVFVLRRITRRKVGAAQFERQIGGK